MECIVLLRYTTIERVLDMLETYFVRHLAELRYIDKMEKAERERERERKKKKKSYPENIYTHMPKTSVTKSDY